MTSRESTGGARAHAGMAGPTIDGPARVMGRRSPPLSDETVHRFVALSVALTGFDDAELWGTGMVEEYLGFTWRAVGGKILGDLLSTWADISSPDERGPGAPPASTTRPNDGVTPVPRPKWSLEHALHGEILMSPTYGPVARNIAVLWYLGQWNQLPADWRDVHGANATDQTSIISPEAYTQGLVWDAIGAHPQGAKMPGFGSWALPPKRLPGIPTGDEGGDA